MVPSDLESILSHLCLLPWDADIKVAFSNFTFSRKSEFFLTPWAAIEFIFHEKTKLACGFRRSTSSRPWPITLAFLESCAALVDLSLPNLLTALVYIVLKPDRKLWGHFLKPLSC